MSRSIGEHVRCPEGTLINNRFKVVREIGCGNFAKVYKCTDVQHPSATPVAVKILKREYAADAAFEADILKALNAKDKRGHKVVRMLDQFTWSRCPCFVFALRGASLRSRKFGISRGHIAADDLRKFADEMLKTLNFLHHEVRMVHTDLKPENILIDDESLPSPTSGIGTGWTIADFGSASFYNPAKPDSDLISTRPYRAPEVVLGLPWSTKADVFSMGCIFFEMFYGARLFEVNDDAEHLSLFEKRIAKLPLSLTRSSKHFRRYFDNNGALLRGSSGAYSARTSASSSGTRHLSEVVTDDNLRDLLTQMLDVDPTRRASAQDCLRHPYLAGRSGSAAAVSPLRKQMERMALHDAAPSAPSAADYRRPSVPSSQPASRSSSAAAFGDKENAAAAMPSGYKQSAKMSPAVPAVNVPRVSAAAGGHYRAAAPLGSARTNDIYGGMPSSRASIPLSGRGDMPAAGKPSNAYRAGGAYW